MQHRRYLTCLVLVLAATTTACGGQRSAEPTAQTTLGPLTDSEGAAPTPTATDAATEGGSTASVPPIADDEADTGRVADPAAADLQLSQVAEMDAPIAMTVRPVDDTMYVAERAGTVRSLSPDGQVGEAIIDISGSTATDGERGLLGLAWSADGQTLYLSSSDDDGSTRLESFAVADNVVDPTSRRELLRVPQPASNHNGGDLHLGPDGMLWLGLGDGGAANDRFGNGQRPDTLLGAMLRIDPTAGDPYGIPQDNPFEGTVGAEEVWAYGLRNPWRFSFDSATGSLWIADVGQNAVEEINRVRVDDAGLNYGWPHFEGDRPFDGGSPDGPVVDPVHTYEHDRGCSITGGYVYRGTQIPDLTGAYLYTDYCNGTIYALATDNDGLVGADVDTGMTADSIASFGEGPDGELYVLSLDGPVYRIEQL